MYYKDKTEKLVIRISKDQMNHLNNLAEITEISKSDLIRGYIDRTMSAWILKNDSENIETN